MDNTIPQDTPQKQCKGPCGQFFPATTDYFHVHSAGRLRPMCRTCRNASKLGKGAEYYATHKEKYRAYYVNTAEKRKTGEFKQQRRQVREKRREKRIQEDKAYHKAHPERSREHARIYRNKHREEIQQRQRQERAANREKYRIRSREAARRHRDVQTVSSRNRRARMRAAEGKLTLADIRKQHARQKGLCYYCRCKLTKYHVDHVIPLSRGGSNWPDNIVLACPPCNCKKHDKLPHEFFEGGRLM